MSSTAVAAARVRPRGDAGGDRRAPGRRPRRRAGDAAADPRPRRRGLARYDTSSLRYIASSGSALGAPLATAVLRRFGPMLYNIYGSTEVALATVAAPADLQAAPSTAGRVGARQRRCGSSTTTAGEVLDAATSGGSSSAAVPAFEGYTGGGGKEEIDGLLSSGDVGHFDAKGRLFIDGRDDDMIVSGGENVFPAEVEDLLAAHPAVAEAAVVGVADDEFGQVLEAFVVRRPGAKLTAGAGQGPRARPTSPGTRCRGTVTFVDALPRTTTGKLRRLDLLTATTSGPSTGASGPGASMATAAATGWRRLGVDVMALARNPPWRRRWRAASGPRPSARGCRPRRRRAGARAAVHHHDGGRRAGRRAAQRVDGVGPGVAGGDGRRARARPPRGAHRQPGQRLVAARPAAVHDRRPRRRRPRRDRPARARPRRPSSGCRWAG